MPGDSPHRLVQALVVNPALHRVVEPRIEQIGGTHAGRQPNEPLAGADIDTGVQAAFAVLPQEADDRSPCFTAIAPSDGTPPKSSLLLFDPPYELGNWKRAIEIFIFTHLVLSRRFSRSWFKSHLAFGLLMPEGDRERFATQSAVERTDCTRACGPELA
jgi:hypothetical protein